MDSCTQTGVKGFLFKLITFLYSFPKVDFNLIYIYNVYSVEVFMTSIKMQNKNNHFVILPFIFYAEQRFLGRHFIYQTCRCTLWINVPHEYNKCRLKTNFIPKAFCFCFCLDTVYLPYIYNAQIRYLFSILIFYVVRFINKNNYVRGL